jgi:hypothetical protein
MHRGDGQLDASTASVIIGLGAAVVTGGLTLAGVVLTQRSSRQQQADILHAQERKDEAAQEETRRYRNHERRINAAAQFIAALNAFRRAVNDLDPGSGESRGNAHVAARASADAGALVHLYFSKSVQERSTAASGIVVDMHLRKLNGLGLDNRDNAAKTARDELVDEMKRQLGESEDQQGDSKAASSDTHEPSSRR